MENSKYQIQFERDGFLLVRDIFSSGVIESIKREIDRISAFDGPEFFREASGAIRTIFSPDKFSGSINDFIRSEEILKIVKDLLGEPFYLFQSKFNDKKSLESGTWPWHQDFKFWKDDGMPSDKAITVAIYLTDVTDFSGPILCVPGSHKSGEIMTTLNNPEGVHSEDLKYMITPETLAEICNTYGAIHSTQGKAGCALFFHSSLLHSSFQNMHFEDRKLLMFTFNPVSNQTVKTEDPRPDYMVRRDFTEIKFHTDQNK